MRTGLISGFVRIIKNISRNLDAEGTIHFDKGICESENNQKEITETLNGQFLLISKIIEHFEKTLALLSYYNSS